jgi:hypothetical protein
MALDTMVNAMMALAVTHDRSETDFLVGIYVDAESAYKVAEAVVQAAPRSHGPAVMELRRAFETEGRDRPQGEVDQGSSTSTRDLRESAIGSMKRDRGSFLGGFSVVGQGAVAYGKWRVTPLGDPVPSCRVALRRAAAGRQGSERVLAPSRLI